MASTTLSTSNTTTSSAQTTKRLTGWAQAAARSAPSNIKKSEKQVELKVTKLAGSNDSASSSKKKTSTPNSNANHSINNNNSKSSGSGTVSNKKHFNKQSFNRNEVRSYMNDLFLKYEKSPKTLSYQNVVKNNKNSPNEIWGTVQSKSNRNKNKKYGLLTDVAKLLK